MARRMSFTSSHISTRIDLSGPMFDGRAIRAAREYVGAAELDVGEHGVQIIRRELDRVLKHPTGYYRSNIHAVKRGAHVTIDDNRVIYGPWLEGTGSRNSPVTRFKGYSTFRRMFRKINADAARVATELLRAQYLRRMQ